MEFKRYIVLRYNDPYSDPEYDYLYSEANLYNIDQFKKMGSKNKHKNKHKTMRDFGFCEGIDSTMIVDTHHNNMTSMYKDLLENIKDESRNQVLEKILNEF